MKLQDRIKALVAAVSTDMFEREEIIAVALLGALCGQNTFLYGPPGTAKSLISRRIACAFESPTYFEYLMHRFSTPEEVFGPALYAPTLEGQYIIKNVVLIAAGLVVGATVRGGRMVADPDELRGDGRPRHGSPGDS